MRQKLISLIDKYEKKLFLEVSTDTQKYYLGKIESYRHVLGILEANGGDN